MISDFGYMVGQDKLSLIQYMKNETFLKFVRNTSNADLLMELRDSIKGYAKDKPKICAARLNQLGIERFKNELTLAFDYNYIPNSLLMKPFVSVNEAIFFPEILKICTYMPRAVIEYMCYYMQVVIYPVIHNRKEDKYKFFINKDIASFNKYYLFPFSQTKDSIYSDNFLEQSSIEYCLRNAYTLLDYRIFGFYNLKFQKETSFKLILLLELNVEETNGFSALKDVDIRWLDIFSKIIIDLIEKEK